MARLPASSSHVIMQFPSIKSFHAVVGLSLGGQGKTEKGGRLWWHHHTQPTVISTFDQAYRRIRSWDYGM